MLFQMLCVPTESNVEPSCKASGSVQCASLDNMLGTFGTSLFSLNGSLFFQLDLIWFALFELEGACVDPEHEDHRRSDQLQDQRRRCFRLPV